MTKNIPVITLDGPSGSGKGTISVLLAQKLQWHFLDSGALYRILAKAAENHQVALDDEAALEQLAHHLDVKFQAVQDTLVPIILLENHDVSLSIRTETCGNMASKVAALPKVRAALLERQRAFRQAPGLVTDGRDMGTVVFPDATIKFFIVASAAERAQRRCKQLQEKGIAVNFENILAEINERDDRDKNRSISPLVPAASAITVDTTGLSIQQVFDRVWQEVEYSTKSLR